MLYIFNVLLIFIIAMAEEDNYGMFINDNEVQYLQAPYLDFGWDGNPSMQDYINRITPEVADEMEFQLGINGNQEIYHIDVPLHPNYQALQEFVPSRDNITDRMETILRYALPQQSDHSDDLGTDPEPNTVDLQGLYEGIGYVCFVISIISIPFI
jgi:hypothetical protein